jgi:hypothetical protein
LTIALFGAVTSPNCWANTLNSLKRPSIFGTSGGATPFQTTGITATLPSRSRTPYTV